MATVDRLGRRRAPGQGRGLRPLFPKLPERFASRLLRVAMASGSWNLFEQLVNESAAPTRPRAIGEILELAILAVAEEAAGDVLARSSSEAPRATDWQQWQIEKEAALLKPSRDWRSSTRHESEALN